MDLAIPQDVRDTCTMVKKKHRQMSSPPAAASRLRKGLFSAAGLVAAVLLLVLWPRGADETAPGVASPDVEQVAPPVFTPAEFDPQDALLLGASPLFELFPRVLVDIVSAAHSDIRIVLLIEDERYRRTILDLLAASGLPDDSVEFVQLPIMSMWVRDFGPVTVADGAGRRRLVDFVYRERRGNAVDNGVPEHLARVLDWPRTSSVLLLEGGDFLSNGLGLCLGSTRLINRNAHYLELEPRQVVPDLARVLGFENVVLLRPLQGETTGHVDMFCTFVAPDLVVVGQLAADVDSVNAALLDETAEQLAGVATRAGPLRIERIAMPPPDGDVWRTYTNVIFANSVMLVPTYPDRCPELDAKALALYRRLLPDRRVVGVDVSDLITMRGALRCISLNVAEGVLPTR